MRREQEKTLSVKTGEGATTVVSVKQGALSKATINWLVAGAWLHATQTGQSWSSAVSSWWCDTITNVEIRRSRMRKTVMRLSRSMEPFHFEFALFFFTLSIVNEFVKILLLLDDV